MGREVESVSLNFGCFLKKYMPKIVETFYHFIEKLILIKLKRPLIIIIIIIIIIICENLFVNLVGTYKYELIVKHNLSS
jgi:hypothetical protein